VIADLDYLSAVADESTRFAATLRSVPPQSRVPSCPDWTAADLLWHLTEVQWFWAHIIADRVRTTADADALEDRKPERDQADPAGQFERVSADLQDQLRITTDDVRVWTWASDQSVGFVRRRQAHEALIHRVDADLTAGRRTPIDSALAADGVDEALGVMFGGVPDFGTFVATPGQTVRFVAEDVGRSWVAALGRFTGREPNGDYVDVADLRLTNADHDRPVAATVRAAAADLDCWLWNRPPAGAVTSSGSDDVLAAFEAQRGRGIN
jgi:uncharacterized protein (TIGR03083 family)